LPSQCISYINFQKKRLIFIRFAQHNQVVDNENKLMVSIYLKELLSYSQVLSIIVTFNYKWPFYVYSYLHLSSILGSLSSQVFSIDCLLNYGNESPLHFKALVAVLLPFFIWTIMVFMTIVNNVRKNEHNYTKLFSFFVIISNFLQPYILQQLFNNLRCINLGDRSFLYMDMKTECDSENHLNWV